ncbi:unnamed protein product [Parnassius mnemosyne]
MFAHEHKRACVPSGELACHSSQFLIVCDGGRSRARFIAKMASRKCNATLEKFIEIYKSEGCLWRVKCKEYHDRDKRSTAYEKLKTKLKELEPTATKDDVIKKINTLRSNVRREEKKYDESVKSGASSNDIYKTTLWYFELFDFIGAQDVPRSSRSNISEIDENDSNISIN